MKRPKAPAEKPRLLLRYRQQIVPELMKRHGYKTPMQVPVIDKIVVNMGVGEAVAEQKRIEAAAKDLSLIAGQKPIVTRARTSISGFKLRKNLSIGCKVTLRRYLMYEFLDRLIHVALPRVRDFRGVRPDGFDRQGNYNLGLAEQTVFPEVSIDHVEFPQGLDIAIVVRNGDVERSRELLRAFGMPFSK